MFRFGFDLVEEDISTRENVSTSLYLSTRILVRILDRPRRLPSASTLIDLSYKSLFILRILSISPPPHIPTPFTLWTRTQVTPVIVARAPPIHGDLR